MQVFHAVKANKWKKKRLLKNHYPTCRLGMAPKFSSYLVLVERIFLCYVVIRGIFSHACKGLSQVINSDVLHVVVHFVVDWLLVSWPQLSWQPKCLRPKRRGSGSRLRTLGSLEIADTLNARRKLAQDKKSFSRPGIFVFFSYYNCIKARNFYYFFHWRTSRSCLTKNLRWLRNLFSVVFVSSYYSSQ